MTSSAGHDEQGPGGRRPDEHATNAPSPPDPLAHSGLPRVLADTGDLPRADRSGAGAAWSLAEPQRDLDSNVINLPPGVGIGEHTGPDVDVLIHVLAGSGQLLTEGNPVNLRSGLLVWLPRRSRRQFVPGPGGLTYLTVHQRRPSQGLWPGSPPG